MKLILISVFAVILMQLQAQLLPNEIKVLKTPTGNIEGTLMCPPTVEKVPLVLIISGSGPTDRDGNNVSMQNNSLKFLGEALKTNNIASLRYDKRGIGKSTPAGLNESELRFDNYIDDVVAWVKFLKTDNRFSSITIAGHSEGSLIGMLACQKVDVSKYVSIAGAAYPAAEIIRQQLAVQSPLALSQAESVLSSLEQGKTTDNIPEMLRVLFRPSVQPYMISWFKYDPREEIARISCPIILIQGNTDIQVSVENAKALHDANPTAQLSIIDGMNHILKNAPVDRMQNIATYNQADLELNQEFVKALVEFISTPSL